MGRPSEVIQRKRSGVYFVLLHLNGRRVTRSLETKDQVVATKRASQAIRELQAEAELADQNKWEADMAGTEWETICETVLNFDERIILTLTEAVDALKDGGELYPKDPIKFLADHN